LKELENWRCPRILLDAWSPTLYGGTGKRLDPELVQKARSATALWMAGGISPDNIAQIVGDFQPELVDVSSRLESEPGHKDPGLMRRFFQEIEAITAPR
jgi:indole-3-glycerol phosphate synthase/phosphoribosylanthranilate isomerase